LEHFFPLHDQDGTTIGINVVAEEITERKRQERHQRFLSELGLQLRLLGEADTLLEQLVQRLGHYLQVTNCRINQIDLTTEQFTVQKEWARNGENITGTYPLSELAPAEILHELQAGRTVVVANTATDPRTASVIANYRAQQTAAFVGVPIFHEGQWWATLSIRADREREWQQDEIALLETVTNQLGDLLQKVQAEEALRQLNATLEQRVAERTAELERSNHDLDQFAYVASHDLKAPLRGIDSLATWISEDAAALLPDASKEHLSKLRGRVGRMERLLEDLLTYSRVGRRDGQAETVDTGAVVRDMVELLAAPAGFKVTISGTLPTIQSPRAPLELVLRNLIGNAIKHHHDPANGLIQISAQDRGDYVEFTVADNGPGIEPQHHARIFSMFQTLRPRDEMEGSGMGLAIVQRAIEFRRGEIRVESNLGNGAIFTFTWPKSS
jgi:signal transduction histidine kinase